METQIIVALIGFAGVIASNAYTSRRTQQAYKKDLEIMLAVQNEKIEELTREAAKHNGFAERVPRLEAKVDDIDERVKRLEK
jgi:uncharacterized coiled-coil protein SlyX